MFSETPLDARPQAADAADVQQHLHAGLAGPVQRLADLRVLQRVDLGHDQARPVGRRGLDFALDQVDELLPQVRSARSTSFAQPTASEQPVSRLKNAATSAAISRSQVSRPMSEYSRAVRSL